MERLNRNMKIVWTGRVISALVALPFIMGIAMVFSGNPQVSAGLAHAGIPASLMRPIIILELLSVLLYLIPATSVLGAILLAGYMGGAILTHLRIGEAVYLQVSLGVLAWLGLYLREPRLHSLLPLRKLNA